MKQIIIVFAIVLFVFTWHFHEKTWVHKLNAEKVHDVLFEAEHADSIERYLKLGLEDSDLVTSTIRPTYIRVECRIPKYAFRGALGYTGRIYDIHLDEDRGIERIDVGSVSSGHVSTR